MNNKKLNEILTKAFNRQTDGKTLVEAIKYVAENTGGGSPEVLTEYPTTDASKAGQRFIYKGNEWHYMTQPEIDSTGWNGLVDVGFPAPVSKVWNPYIYLDGYIYYNAVAASSNRSQNTELSTILNILGLGNPTKVSTINNYELGVSPSNVIIVDVIGFNLLTNLVDVNATLPAIALANTGMSAEILNKMFTELPNTSKTVTIQVTNNPGSATCDPTIATAKGYTVAT